jgi:hypothetical protein
MNKVAHNNNLNEVKINKVVEGIISDLTARVFNCHFLDTKTSSVINLFEVIVKKI